MSDGWDEFVKKHQQPGEQEQTRGNDWAGFIARNQSGGMQQTGTATRVSQMKQPKAVSAEALRLPTIGAAEQVRQGLVGAAAIQTARDDRSANRQAGRGFSALAEGGITAAPAGTTGKRTAPLTKAQAEQAYARVGQLETEISAMEARLEESWNAMQQQETRISQMEQRLQTLYAELEKNPTQSGMEMYNQAYHQYERAWAEYMNGYRSYEAAYRGYEGARKQYEDSLTTYNDYISLFVKEDGSYDYEALARAAQEEYDAYTGTEAYRQEQAAAFTPGSAYLTGGTTQPVQQGSSYLTGGGTPERETSRAEELKIMADYYRYMADQEKEAAITAANLKALESWSEEDRRLLELVIDTRTGSFGNLLETMGAALSSSGASQKAAYGHQTAAAQALRRLSEKYGEQTVLNLAESLSRSRNQEITRAAKDSAAAGAYGPGGATGSSILSVGANLAGSILAPVGALSEWATSTGQYKTLDPNNLGMVANAYAGQVRKTVADQIRSGGSAVGQAGAVVYESGMSAIDNFMRIIATGGSEIGSLALAGTGSFGQTVAEASANGASPGEALGLGAAAGFIEIGTEKLPLEKLLAQARNAPSGLVQAITEIAKQAGTEITEEEISLLSNTMLEIAVLQDTASYRLRIGELMDSGSSYAEAANTVNDELFKEIVTTAIQSGLSGSMMSGATIGFSYLTETPEQRAARRVQRQHEGPEAQLMANGNRIEVQLETGTATAVQLSTRGNVSIVEGLTVAEEKAKIAGRLSELLGRDIVFYEKTREDDNGYYSGLDGRIYLATKNNRIVEQTIGHELTHSIEQAGAYRDLADIVMRHYDAAGVDVDSLRQGIRERYAAGGHELATQDDVDRELVAEYVEQYLLSDEKSIRAVCRENRSLGQKIHDWLTNLLAKLGSKRAQGNQFLIQARDIYAKALAESRGSFTEQTAPAAKPAQPATDAGKTVSQANTGNPDVDQLIRFFEEQFAAGEISREEMQENIDSVKAQAAGKTAAPEPDESRMEGLSLPTLEDGQMADSDEDDDYSRDRHEIMLEDQEVAGKALSYSYGGTNARGADMEELKRAKVMASQNVDPETIRQETGWFRGSDGKWRFEIDDREMTYDRRGNHRGAADRRSAEEDLKIVRDDLFRDMPWEDRPKVIDWARAEHNGNRAEAQEIYDELGAEYGMEFYEYTRAIRRVWETSNAPRGGFLPDYISHPTLFDHYPELNRVAVVIEPLDGSTRGEYRPRSNTIALSENLMEGAEETILHEIQHVIQEIEGFARGSNPRFWEEFQKGATPIRTNDGKIARLEARIEEILDGLPENVAAQFQRFDELEKTDSQEAYAIAEELGEGPWAKQFSDYFMTVWDLELARQYNRARNANDLYRNTAGEIEARDTAARRSMTPEERKNTPPDLGGEETVFMEGTADPASYVGTTAEGVEVYETSEEVRKLPWAERKKRFLDLMRNQYRGRTAKFVRNGHSYYAKFDYRGVSKNIYGDDKSNDSGRDAKINVGADGGIFELVENARFRNSLPETGKQGPVHNSVQYWDYFVKTVQIDGKAYDVVANVRRKADGDYVYLIEMHENTKIEASLPEDSQNSGLSGAPNTSVVSVSNAVQDVKRYSVGRSRELSQTENEAVRIFGTTKSFAEAGYLMPDGSMLRFTDDQHGGRREYDHRAIAMAYGEEVDLGKNHGFSFAGGRYLDEFVEAGNIRFDSGEPDLGMDIGMQLSSRVPLTKAQEQLIRDLVEWKQQREADFEAHMTEDDFLYTGPLAIRIDFGGDSEYATGAVSSKDLAAWGKKSLEYTGRNISAQQIIHDIRRYYETGETTQRSTLNQFRYSVSPEDSQGRELTPEQKRFFRGSKVRDAQGRLIPVYHGTRSMGFTVFDPWYSDDKTSLFFSAGKSTARTYSDSFGRESDTYAIDRDTDMGQFRGPAYETAIRDALREAGYEMTSGELITDRAEAEAFAEGIHAEYREAASQEGTPKDRIYKKQMAAEMTDLALTGSNGWYRVSAGYLGEELLIDRESAEQMASQSDGPGKGLYEVYLNLTNPFVLDCKGREWNDIGYDALKGEGVPRYEGGRTRDVTAWAKANGYDGVIFENVVDLGAYEAHATEALGPDTVYVAFSPEQVKSTANKTPTSDPDIRYSVGRPDPEGLSLPTVEDGQDVKSLTPHRDQLPAKARDYLGRAESKLLRKLQSAMSVPGGTKRMILKPLVQQISEEYLREGRISDQRIDELFEQAWTRGIIVDTAYYDTYKEVKDYIRTTGVTLKRRDQADIADFGDFKKRAFGTIRIVNDGLPVDTAYGELHTMAPNLFPESITHPADQLARMFEVAQGIRKSEQTLDEFYRKEFGEAGTGEIKRNTRHEFDKAIGEILTDLRDTKQYAEEQAAAEKKAEVPMTVAEAMEVYAQLKEARRIYERTNARYLLKEADRTAVNKLLEGRLTLEDLDPAKENVRAVTEVYEAKAEYERLIGQIRRYKQGLRAAMRKKADSYLQTALQWKDKAVGIAYSRETMERNFRDIIPDRDLAKRIIREYITPVHRSEAESNRFRNEYRDRVRGLELSRKVKKGNIVSEAHAVQLLGEATDNIAYLQKLNRRNAKRDGKTLEEWQAVVMDLWEQNPGLDQAKIEGAVKEFRKIYDELFQRMNEVRVANGYEPVNYRQGYFPHFQPGDGDGILGAFGRAVGIDTQVAALPTTINGLTHTFKPGITWFGNAQERLGFNTAYDAVEGFDKYIEGVASVIYHTENIQKLRALATQIRYNASDEGIKKQVDAIIARTELTEDEKQALINDIYGKARYNLSNFVTELEEYTNLLANKKSKLDRTTEALIGRRCYTFMKAWESRVGANMIAGNLTSAMTNFIPITQAAARVGHQNMLKGMWDTLKAMKEDDGILGQSAFLTNRRGADPLVTFHRTGAFTVPVKIAAKHPNIAKFVERNANRAIKRIDDWRELNDPWESKVRQLAGLPMELIDNFVSGAVVRAAYYRNLKKGLSEAEAMEQADSFAAGVMADRSKGSMPTLFESTNPLFKLFTQFQLEVNNQWSEVLKDLPAEVQENYPDAKAKQVAALTGVMLQYFLGALLYNEAYEYFVGRRPAMDPFGILNDTVGDLTGYELPNLVQWGVNAITGEETDFETEKVHFGDAMANLATNVAGELPFSSALALAGIEVDNGRVPAASAIPDLTVLKDVLFNPDWSDAKRLKEAEDELWKLSYILPPFGGNQLQKIWKGLKVYFEGGSYTVNSAGEEMLQYPVFRDEDGMDWMTAVQAAMMGKSSLTEAQDWVNEGFNSLGAKQTAAYRDLLEAGVDDRDAWDLLRRMSDAEAGEDETKQDVQRVILSEAEIPEAGKAIVYYGLLASESERELMDQMADAGTEQDRLYGLMLQWRRIGSAKGAEKKLLQYDLVAGFAGTDQEKGILAAEILGTELVNENGNPTAYADYLNATQAGLEPGDFFRMRYEGVNMDDYFGLTDQGLRPEEARDLLVKLEDLQPPEGEDEVEDVQRWRTCVDFSGDEAIQLAALRGETSDSLYLKFELATQMGVSLDSYVGLYEIREQFDANGNGSYTNAEVKAAIDSMTGYQLTAAQKAVLWQLMTGSTSSKNNPYSPQVGQQVIDARKAQKEGQ